jgi:uncharacterized C2H2 Zn-finger protein
MITGRWRCRCGAVFNKRFLLAEHIRRVHLPYGKEHTVLGMNGKRFKRKGNEKPKLKSR